MPRPFFPHTLDDITRNVDGGLGLVVGDMPDGSIWVLKRNRKTPGYVLTHWADSTRKERLEARAIAERVEAVNTMAAAIGIAERLPD